MNKKGQSETILVVLVLIAVVVLIVFGSLKLAQYDENKKAQENCRLMGNNGHTVKIEQLHYYGLAWDDCYIMQDNNKWVPYDRYRAME